MSKRIAKLLNPPSSITQYDDEAYTKNPLLKFHIDSVRKRRHYTLLKRKAADEKIRMCRKVDDGCDDDVLDMPMEFYINLLHISTQSAPIPRMLDKTEKQILAYVPQRLRDKYPNIAATYMADVHAEFDKIIKAFSLQKILVARDGDFIPARDSFRFKRLGKTVNYAMFLRNRQKLKATLLIWHPFVRGIVNHAAIEFPELLNDYGKYRASGEITLDTLVAKTTQDLIDNASFIKKQWYPKRIAIIKKYYKKRYLPPHIFVKTIPCMSGLINRQLNALKIRTFNHIREILLDRDRIPYLMLYAVCDNEVKMFPTIIRIFNVYHSIVNEIAMVGTQLDPLERWLDIKGGPEYLRIQISNEFMSETHELLQNTLDKAYAPILIYRNGLRNEFYELYCKETKIKLQEFQHSAQTFENYLSKIEEFKLFIDRLKRLVVNVFFDMATVCQKNMIARLREIADNLIREVVEQIVAAHKRESVEICAIFDGIRERALEIPRSTEQLLDNGEFMTHVKTVLIFELQDRIQQSLHVSGILLEFTELSDDLVALQMETIKSYHTMHNLGEQNASLFEMYKLQFEEHLQAVAKKLNEDIAEMLPNLSVIDDMCEMDKYRDYYALLQNIIDKLRVFDDFVRWINKEEVLFKFPKTFYPILDEIKEYVIPFAVLMRMCITWLRYYHVWMDGPFEYLVPEFVERTTDEYYKEFLKTQKTYRNRIKQDLIGNPVCKFRGQTEDPDIEKHPVPLKLCGKMIQWIKDFRTGVYMVNIMCNPALRDRHWNEISEIAGFDLTPDAGTTLRKLLNAGLNNDLESYEIISIGANKELQLQQNLAAMIAEWENIVFTTSQYKETNITILSSLDDIQALLEEHLLKTLTMRGSAFVKPCETEVRRWYDKLTRVNNTLDQWGKVQASWLYLLPIFSSKDIVAQMPEEGRLFTQVDNIYRRNMTAVIKQPLVMETAPTSGLLEAFESANVMLDDITNGVNAYLEKKRLYFPRFFFLSNDEMLEILSETKDPLRVQPHLNKCFEGIYLLNFDEKLDIHSMISADREDVRFVNVISTNEARGSVEKWLLRVEEEMLTAVKNELANSFTGYVEKDRKEWVLDWPQMIILCVSQIFWAAEVHECLKSNGSQSIESFAAKLQTDLNDIVALIRSHNLSNLNRIAIKSLIVIDVHAKDVVHELIAAKVQTANDFQWLSQLRYYWEDNACQVRIINATVPYANEYLGNSDRLVITPLTDRCYRTLIGAYQLHLNGAPEGPAGTGKTETTKDLAKALAVQCKVFNCSDGLDYKAMGKFFKGLASSGAWACFDEFNRIELEVLSVVAQQILSIIVAVRSRATKFLFEGTELQLNPACYVCITMNPGYAGRSELPDNLKVLFRTVAMMVPDYAMIGEISLYSFGFVNARVLAVKIVTTYRLCSEQLSSQNHYDYGMRAVKTVLQACGNVKKLYPDEDEEILLLRSLLDVNLPKFLSFDIPLFEGIISDVFPGVRFQPSDYELFHTVFENVCRNMNLQPKHSFRTKVIQTYEMMIVRHGFMMVGEPFAGKTSTLQVLSAVMALLKENATSAYYQQVEMEVVNPKAITMAQLYGAFDPISYEWTDGVASTIFRNFAMDKSANRKWLIFDGPVDAVWIENMNTVLDDNKKLCLTSGEVITMTNEMSMIFEVMDLTQASPATVSRCGMIYMEPNTLGWQSIARSWLATCDTEWSADHRDYIIDLLEWIVPDALKFIRRHCTQLLYPGEMNMVVSTLKMIKMLMDDAIEENPDDYAKFTYTWIQAAMIYALVWGIGGTLDNESRSRFDTFFREWHNTDENGLPPETVKVEVAIPADGILFDYTYAFRQKGAWKHWPDIVRRIENESSALGIQVPTIDTARYISVLDLHLKHKTPMLLVGPTGTGKSFYIQNTLMNKSLPDIFVPAFITFTVMISANQTQELILSKLNKKKRGYYGPPPDKTSIIFIDDMNMPAKEQYGAQPPIELIRQFFDYGHWYDLKEPTKIFLNDILIMAACGLPGGSRQDVYARFLRHFNVFAINNFAYDTMFKIFQSILLNGFKRNGHGSDVMSQVNQIVAATLHMYSVAMLELRPTPAKSHYIFNLRDVSRIICGCSLLKKESVEHKRMFARIWVHEAMRVFYDRLVDATDREWFFARTRDSITEHFRDRFDTVFEDYANESGVVSLESVNNLVFGTYQDLDAEAGDRRYEEISLMDAFRSIALTNLAEYNATHKTKMDICLFQFALQHLNKICRIMEMPAGSSLLIGMSGSGRQSLTKLAATICMQTLHQPEITKNYGMTDWREDLKRVLRASGGAGKDTVFLLTENQIKMESFLQDIDCLLNLGEVPNIFPIDERQEILEMVRLVAQGGNRNIDISPLQVFSFFVNRCKQKLHMILCFSPIGSAFRTRIRMYPSLVNCCTIDWYDAWPPDALEMVAERYMQTINVPDTIKKSAVGICQHFHITARTMSAEFFTETGRITYITSASYLELIKSYRNLMERKQTETMDAKMRYMGGLDTLLKAADAVAIMQHDLSDLQPKLLVMAENSRLMTEQIEKKTIEASVATEQVKKDEVIANVQSIAAQTLKKECEKDLAQAIPILDEATNALKTLKPTDITLVKSMKNPPEVVKLVMAAVCVIKGIAPDRINDPATGKKILDFWGPSKRILGDMGFLQALKDFDRDNISTETMKRIRKEYIPHKDFQPHIVAKASSAAEGLCKWIIAMDLYDAVAKIVAPKKAKRDAAVREYMEMEQILNEKRQLAAELEQRVVLLNEQLAQANLEKKRVEDEVEMCKNKLIRAEKLIGSLGGERHRWTTAAEHLQKVYDDLAGDILICCGIIAYLAPFTLPYREKCVADWFRLCKQCEIPCSAVFSFVNSLGSEIKIQSWNLYELPRDTFSVENAIIMDNSDRYSLFIDPQGQANTWIKTMEKHNRLQVVKFTQPNYMKVLEVCIEFGNPVLIESVQEELDAPLDPLLAKNTFRQGKTDYISFGDNVIPFSPNFRLFLTSASRNPHYLPEVYNKVTIINFALTAQGLEEQLLGIVVAKERPDLQEIRLNLIVESAKNKTMLKEVEDSILYTMSQSKGDILEDESAILILDNSKTLSVDILAKQAASKETEIKIESFRQSYRPVAVHSSILYYCITDLPNIDPMYQFSLAGYISLYIQSVENANKSKDLVRRLKFLIDMVTLNLYNSVCRSIFEKDKLLFAFILTTKIMLASNQIRSEHFMFLLTGGADGGGQSQPNPDTMWISDKMWEDIQRLEQISEFGGFVASFSNEITKWKHYYDHYDEIPGPWHLSLSRFEKILIVKTVRPDKMIEAIQAFVTAEMGGAFVKPPPFEIARSFEDSNCLMPLVFILSPGADPMGALLLFAEKMGMDETFEAISLGQGQGPIAERLLQHAQEVGSWVCLQNCHLAASWMPTLENLWENMDIFNTPSSFRMWLTSYPTDKFPTALLQNGVKMTNEPPTGLQQNLLRSYNSEPMNDEQFYVGCPNRNRAFTRLLYGICFFHAVVQERRKFGPLGWNIAYGFNESDFQISVQQLQRFLNQYEDIPYVAIAYLTGECNYGGRVTDAWDRRAIVTILSDYINENVVNDNGYRFVAGVANGVNESVYIVPRKTEHREVLKFISDNIPTIASPEVYGLHSNAGITRDLHAANALLDTMILTVGKVSGTSEASTDKSLQLIVRDIASRLPRPFDIEMVSQKYPVDYDESMNTVLVQELQRFNKLIVEIHSTCANVDKAIDGIVVMTPALEHVAIAIIYKRIPHCWSTKAYPSLKSVGSFVHDLIVRLNWLERWCVHGKPATFWISGFFFTQAFLTGAMQNYARKYKTPIDTLTFDFSVQTVNEFVEPPEDGVYINGLYLEGARWDTGRGVLVEQIPKILVEQMPAIQLMPCLVRTLNETARYRCPLYKTAERKGTLSTTGHSTNYVLPILLDTHLPATHWVKRSAALICQTSD